MNLEISPKGFFRCPHCRQKTITALTKAISPSPYVPGIRFALLLL